METIKNDTAAHALMYARALAIAAERARWAAVLGPRPVKK